MDKTKISETIDNRIEYDTDLLKKANEECEFID